MDAVKYLKLTKKITQAYGCSPCNDECPLSCANNGHQLDCSDFIIDYPEEAVEIVAKWAAEHPVKTRQSEFLKMFPNAGMEDGIIKIDPCKVDTKNIPHNGMVCDKYDLCADCRRDYWLAEVE